MCRFVAANLSVLALLVAATVVGAHAAGRPVWSLILVGVAAFFGGGYLEIV